MSYVAHPPPHHHVEEQRNEQESGVTAAAGGGARRAGLEFHPSAQGIQFGPFIKKAQRYAGGRKKKKVQCHLDTLLTTFSKSLRQLSPKTMFRATIVALALGSATAFVARAPSQRVTALRMAEEGASATEEKMDLDLEDMFDLFDEADSEVKAEEGAGFETSARPGAPWMKRLPVSRLRA